MRYLMTTNGGGPAPTQELYVEMARFIEELSQAGIVLATGGLSMTGKKVTAKGGGVTMTDGPYAETKETIVSFALVEVDTEEQVLELSTRFWQIVKDGEGDIRQVFGPA